MSWARRRVRYVRLEPEIPPANSARSAADSADGWHTYDVKELSQLLNTAGVEYALVGGYAIETRLLAHHLRFFSAGEHPTW